MNHNLKLNDAAAEDVGRAIADIVDAATRACEFARLSPTVRAYLGAIRDAAWRIDQIVFHTSLDDSEYAVVDTAATAYVETGADACSPYGIVRPGGALALGGDPEVG